MRLLLISLFSFASLCRATTILTVSFSPDTVSANPGQTVSFFGSLTNTQNSTVDINFDSFTFDIPGALDDSPFLNDAPLSLAPNTTSSVFEFFQITIPSGLSAGTFNGAFTIIGGVDANASENLGTGLFHVNTVASSETPEPHMFPVLAFLSVGLFLTRRRWACRSLQNVPE